MWRNCLWLEIINIQLTPKNVVQLFAELLEVVLVMETKAVAMFTPRYSGVFLSKDDMYWSSEPASSSTQVSNLCVYICVNNFCSL